MNGGTSSTRQPEGVGNEVAGLSPERRALLELRLSQKRERRARDQAIARRSSHDKAPLSFAQERLWFVDQLELQGPLYNMSSVVRLHGTFQPDAFRGAFAALIARHEVLRTRFPAVGGIPHQSIDAEGRVSVTVLDISSRSGSDCEAESVRLATEHSQRPFDLAHGPLVRALVAQLSPEEHLLCVTMHHIIADGWSRGVLWRELAALYAAARSGRAAALPPLPIQYADFAVWQRQQCNGESLLDHLRYWKNRLAEAPPLLDLPTDRPRPAVQTGRGTSQTFPVPSELGAALRALGQREDATLFMVLLAAFHVLLGRYTGLDDIVVGSPVAGRTRVELESLIGCFVNTLVFRADLSHRPTFRELLRRVREDAIGAYAHQEVPYERLVQELHPQRQLTRLPLVQVFFALQNVPAAVFSAQGVRCTEVTLENSVAKFDLSLVVWEKPSGLIGEVEYDTDLFDHDTIQRLIGHYLTLLNGIVTNPDRAIDVLPLLTARERRQLLVEWNTPPTEDSPVACCVHRLIERQAAQVPQAVAVVFEQEQLTYQDLDARASQLAHALSAHGVGPGSIVGLSIERSLEMVVGVLGILKSGAAFVPLDPAYPQDRLTFMVRNARLGLVVMQEDRPDLTAWVPDGVIRLSQRSIVVEPRRSDDLDTPVGLADPAYVMYTSGSTGTPKGTLVEHGALARHCLDVIAHYELGPSDRVLQFASLGFDTALEQILPPLVVGATVVLRDRTLWSADDAMRRLSELQVTVADFPTAYFRQLVHLLSGAPGSGGAVPRLVTVGGEALVPEDLALWATTPLRTARLLNAYGPTEATITATAFDVSRQPPTAPLSRVPIGRPLGRRQAFVLDRLGNPVPIGVAGELYLGGACLARGYLHDPELTAERFVERSFDGEPAHRLYRTGDMVRYRADGAIVFLGRADHQIKIRGFRIELAEIEAVLRRHPAVHEAVVLATDASPAEATPGDKRLVAYVVAASGVSSNELRTFLKQALPDFMVPSAIVRLDALPLGPSGKLDRQALPAEDPNGSHSDEAYLAPRHPLEETVARIWAEALKRPHVGVHDNFFEIGGHSLLIVQVQRRLSDALGKEIAVVDLFRHPTIGSLAAFLSEGHERPARAGAGELLEQRRQARLARRQRLAHDVKRG